MFCSVSLAAVEVEDCSKHGAAELYVVFVKAAERLVFSELSEHILS